jgi:hypothetical protein
MSTVDGGWRGPNIVKDGLVLYLDAGSPNSFPLINQSTTWKDISGNVNNGTLTNGPTFNPSNGGSIVFDGTNDYVITTLNATPLLNITSQITLEMWFRSTALANASHGDGLFSKGTSSDGNSGVYEILLGQSGVVNYPFFRIRTSSTPTYNPTNIPINLNQIYHLVCTYNGSIMRIFINGIESGTGLSTSGNIETNSQQLTMGVRYVHTTNPADSFFSGNIYSSRIYNRALSSQEVLQNFNATRARFGI